MRGGCKLKKYKKDSKFAKNVHKFDNIRNFLHKNRKNTRPAPINSSRRELFIGTGLVFFRFLWRKLWGFWIRLQKNHCKKSTSRSWRKCVHYSHVYHIFFDFAKIWYFFSKKSFAKKNTKIWQKLGKWNKKNHVKKQRPLFFCFLTGVWIPVGNVFTILNGP